MLSAVPTGLAILATVPTDKSVGYFHLSLRDKIPIYKKVGMHPPFPVWRPFVLHPVFRYIVNVGSSTESVGKY